MVGNKISVSEVRSQEFKAVKSLSKVGGYHFRSFFFSRIVPHVFALMGMNEARTCGVMVRLSK